MTDDIRDTSFRDFSGYLQNREVAAGIVEDLDGRRYSRKRRLETMCMQYHAKMLAIEASLEGEPKGDAFKLEDNRSEK